MITSATLLGPSDHFGSEPPRQKQRVLIQLLFGQVVDDRQNDHPVIGDLELSQAIELLLGPFLPEEVGAENDGTIVACPQAARSASPSS